MRAEEKGGTEKKERVELEEKGKQSNGRVIRTKNVGGEGGES